MSKRGRVKVADVPRLMAEWHPTRNPGVDPSALATGTKRKVWWKCPVAHDHEWDAAVTDRYKGSGCPCCSGRKASSTNSLAALYPHVAAEWHPTQNSSLTPSDVPAQSNKKVWWKCAAGDDHEWPATVYNRTANRSTCPSCAGRRVARDNTLQALFPEIAEQWDVSANGSKTPDRALAGSDDKVGWICRKGPDHQWRASIRSRTKAGTGCPFCDGKRASVTNSLQALFPELARQWHPTKNGRTSPSSVVAGSHRRYWWRCPKNDLHEWPAPPVRRTREGHGCPFCRGLRVTRAESLGGLYPKVAELWHPTRNGRVTPYQVSFSSNKLRWWCCPRSPEHEWEAPPNRLTRRGLAPGDGCPHCQLAPRSKAEIILAFEVLGFIEFDVNRHAVEARGRTLDVDILLPDQRIAVEFDGAYWHANRVAEDRKKTAVLTDLGWRVIRVRESPLKALSALDVVIAPRAIKAAAEAVLGRIEVVTGKRITGLAAYRRRKTLLRKKEALGYIDQLLGAEV